MKQVFSQSQSIMDNASSVITNILHSLKNLLEFEYRFSSTFSSKFLIKAEQKFVRMTLKTKSFRG